MDLGGYEVVSVHVDTGVEFIRRAKNVVIAVGGKAYIPPMFSGHERIIHASTYMFSARLENPNRIAVVGGGQSAAEITEDLCVKYPNAKIDMLLRGRALKPSDDSPFVNEVFDPDRIEGFYGTNERTKHEMLAEFRSTNYAVVREDLLSRLYERIYMQRVEFGEDEIQWQLRILTRAEVKAIENAGDRTNMKFVWENELLNEKSEENEYDLVVLATGYEHNSWKNLLENMGDSKTWSVGRDYRLNIPSAVTEEGDIWLQGVNETTHGVSKPDLVNI